MHTTCSYMYKEQCSRTGSLDRQESKESQLSWDRRELEVYLGPQGPHRGRNGGPGPFSRFPLVGATLGSIRPAGR